MKKKLNLGLEIRSLDKAVIKGSLKKGKSSKNIGRLDPTQPFWIPFLSAQDKVAKARKTDAVAGCHDCDMILGRG